MEHGICKLCLKEKSICLSHLIPKAMYKYVWNQSNPPVLYTAKEIGPSDEQLAAYLLCKDCENGLNREGENWLLPKLARSDGPFPFYDLVTKGTPDVVTPDYSAYAASKNPHIAFRKLTNFVLGVFWKASVHPWRQARTQPCIDLGPYRESFRKFLNHEATFPAHTHLMLGVAPPDKTLMGFILPITKQRKPYHKYVFHIPGIVFILVVGKMMEEGWRSMCFYTDSLHPIMVCDISRDILAGIQNASRKAIKVERASRILPPQRNKV